MVTSEQVARAAGVSRTTVSRVLNGSPRISPAMRQRVHEAIASLGYEPDVVAQSLVRQRSRVIALGLFPQEAGLSLSELGQTRHYFYLDLLKHIEARSLDAVVIGDQNAHRYVAAAILVRPPIYGLSASGMRTLPSAS